MIQRLEQAGLGYRMQADETTDKLGIYIIIDNNCKSKSSTQISENIYFWEHNISIIQVHE